MNRDRGKGIPHPHRRPSLCPRCGKKGLSNWSARAAEVTGKSISTRDCRYCSYGETWNHISDSVTGTGGEIVKPGALPIRGKLGTYPGDLFYAKGGDYDGKLFDLDGPPSVGDKIFVKSERDPRCLTYTMVKVDGEKNINGQFFFMELI